MRGKLGDRIRVEHMLEAIDLIRSFGPDLSAHRFDHDAMFRSAVTMQLGVIGEAANSLTPDLCAAHPEVDWRNIVGLRNKIIHEYFGLKTQVVIEIIDMHLPVLEDQLLIILKELPDYPEIP